MTAGRMPNLAPIGSLLKTPGQPRGKSIAGKLGKATREKDERHLALIRQLPCLRCGGPSEAAHVRMASAAHEKHSGIGEKPSDMWALPLCHEHHMEQHREGENEFWARLGIDPIALCLKLKAAGSIEKMRDLSPFNK